MQNIHETVVMGTLDGRLLPEPDVSRGRKSSARNAIGGDARGVRSFGEEGRHVSGFRDGRSTSVTQVTQVVQLNNPEGLHLRTCAAIADVVGRHEAKVMVQKDDRSQDGASILGLMTLAAGKGTNLALSATGPDAEEVVLALVELLSTET
jgi:phosphocarrier protein